MPRTVAPVSEGRVARFLPVLGWAPRYRRAWLVGDLLGGLTVVALLVPEGMAYAQLAGVSDRARELLDASGVITKIGVERVHVHVLDAVRRHLGSGGSASG